MVDRLDLIERVGCIILGGAFAGGGFAVADGVKVVAKAVAGDSCARRITFYA